MKKNSSEKTILVYAECFTVNQAPQLVGKLYSEANRNKEHFSFEYDNDWLQSNTISVVLDPDLYMYRGRQYTPTEKSNFGIFADSCPDRWGRLLLKRKEALEAKKEARRPKTLTESDFLLGVHDASRMGALRFKIAEDGDFLSNDQQLATPPWITLRTLENAAFAFEHGDDDMEEKWLKQLLAPGSSLGGARPKATVQAPDGSLWIAKFPSKHDDNNNGAWEMVAHDLAIMCGLNVPEAKLETFSKNGSTFLVKRFDRMGTQRIHFSSAMTLLGKTDGDDDSSYLDIAAFIKSNGCAPRNDCMELWKRIVFSMAITNTDDHLRNHGFIMNKHGWHLSPLYDVNPVPYGDCLHLCVSEKNGDIDFELAREYARHFYIKDNDAQKYVENITYVVKKYWRELANKYCISRQDQERMSPAFEH